MSYSSVIFDLDGTLADTAGDLLAAANACFRDLGQGNLLEISQDRGVAVRGGRAMLRLGLSRLGALDEARVEELYPRLLRHYERSLTQLTTLYPGTQEAVQDLISAGFKVGVCTNKPEALAHQVLVDLGVREMFAALVGGDTLPKCKPDPSPFLETLRRLDSDASRSCLVGDTKTDRDTAKAAHVPSILVTFGPNAHEMPALEPDALCPAFADLPEIVAGLGLKP